MYKIVGGDSKEYGPVPKETIHEWITQGRANAQTMLSFEGGPWRPLSSFPEFAEALQTATPPALAQPVYGAPVYPAGERNNFAIAGLVLSILGIACCCGPLGSILGIIFSAVGLSQINSNPGAYTTTKTIAILGIIIGILGIVATIIMYSTGMMDEMIREIERRSR